MACSYTIFLKCQLYPQTNSNLCWNRKAGWPVPRPAWIWGLKRLSLGQEESKKNNFLLLHGEPQEPEPGSVLPKEVVQMWADWAAQKQDQDHTHTCHPTIEVCLPSAFPPWNISSLPFPCTPNLCSAGTDLPSVVIKATCNHCGLVHILALAQLKLTQEGANKLYGMFATHAMDMHQRITILEFCSQIYSCL